MIIWHLITNDEKYEDETGYQKGEVNRERLLKLRYSQLMNV